MSNTSGKNRATADEAASFVDKYEEFEGEIDVLRVEHMNKVRRVREQQAELLEDAKSQGVAKKVVKLVAQARKLQKKIDALPDNLEDDDAEFYMDIREALGDFRDTPLGAAAVAEADKGPDATTSAIIEAVQSDEARKNGERKKRDAEFDAAAPNAA